MADRRVKVVFSAEIQGFRQAMDEAAKATQKTKKASEDAGKAAETHLGRMVQSATKNSDAWERTGAVTAGAGAAIVAGVGLAIKSYADFDKQMSSVDAATHESAANMKLLREAAVKAGADTAFSAGEAAQGIEELAKAGVSTKDILAGGLNGSLSLAAAGSLGVGEAAEIAASALTQFKLSGDKVPHVADLLAAGAGKAQGSVQDLGAALNQSGLVAASTGLTIEETTGALAAFASAGLTGSDAGTSFKTMLMSLNPNSAAAASLMHELGISAYDAQGNFVGMSEYAGILQNALKGMSDEQRNATLKTLFGSDAVRAANVLYEQGADGISKWEGAVNDAGYAADTAARMQNNLAGDIEKLGGSIDSVFLKSGSGANDFLRGLAKGAEDVVDWIGQIPTPVLNAGAAIAGIVGVAGLAAGAVLNLTPKVMETIQAFDKLVPAGSKARDALKGVGKAAGGAMVIGTLTLVVAKLAEANYMSKIDEGMGRVANVLADVARNTPGAAEGLDSLFKNKDGEALIRDVDSLDSALKRTFRPDGDRQFNDWGEGIINSMTGIKGSSQILGDSFKRVDETMAGLVSGGRAEDAAKVFDRLRRSADAQGISVDELKTKFPEYADALQKADAESKNAAASGDKAAGSIDSVKAAAAAAKQSAEDIAKALEDVGLSADGAVTDVNKFAKALFNAGLLNLSSSDSIIAYEAAIDAVTDSIKENGKSLDDHEPKGRANLTAYNNLAKAAMDTAEAQAAEKLASEGSAAAQATLQGSLQASYDDLIAAAGQFDITGDAADDMARKALGIPKDVPIKTWVEDSASAKLDAIKGKADGLDGRVVNLSVVEQYTKFISEKRNPTEADLNGDTFRPGGSLIVPGLTGGATGGRVSDIMGFWSGGRVPYARPSDMTKDNVIGFVNGGRPIGLQGQEWIINGANSDKYNSELAMINAGTFPKFKEYSASQAGYYPPAAAAPAGPSVSLELNVHGTTAPREVADEAMGLIRFELQKQGVRLGG